MHDVDTPREYLRELEKRDDGEEETHPSTGENRQS